MTPTSQFVLETRAQRDEAEALLRILIDTKAASDRALASLRLAGRPAERPAALAMADAVEAARRLADSYNLILHDIEADLDEHDIRLLEEVHSSRQA